MELITQLPIGYTFFCLLLGALYAGWLYYRDKRFSESPKVLVVLMGVLRFFVVSVLAFFLLTPLLRYGFRELEKPIIVIAQDASQSVVAGKDSVFYKGEFIGSLNELKEGFNEEYEVSTFSFGNEVEENYSQSYSAKQTDISNLFNEIYNKYSHRNVGAIILASDGLYNKGANPDFTAKKLNVPIYTIAMGDTAIQRDLIIKDIKHNRLAYLGNSFPVEVLIDAKSLSGNKAVLTISKNGQKLAAETLDITNKNELKKYAFLLDADRVGVQQYKVDITDIEGEVSYVNNHTSFFIDVLDSRKKVLILANAPHPDVFAIRSAIESHEHYEVETYLKDDFTEPLDAYSLVILHQIPTKGQKGLPNEIMAGKIPVLYVLGSQSSINNFSDLQNVLKIESRRVDVDEVVATVNENFSLFQFSDKAKQLFVKAPPLTVPYGEYKLGLSANTLFYQKVGLVNTDKPLFVFGKNNEQKIAVITGEGIWRWRLYDFGENGNHEAFNELISKTVQYLALSDDKSKFRVTSENIFQENEPIIMGAELYNESLEPVNTADVTIGISNTDGNDFQYSFSKAGNAYTLNAGVLPVGTYKYIAKTNFNDEQYTQVGEFSVNPLRVEYANTVANHQLLYALAKNNGGEMVYATDVAKLNNLIAARDDIKTVSYYKSQLQELINQQWIFFLLLVFLSLEWLLRKRNGAY